MTCDRGQTPDGRPAGAAGVVAVSAGVGGAVGVLYGARDASIACLKSDHFPRTLGGMLSLFGETVLWYAAAFTVVMALAGAALAAAARSRNRTLSRVATVGAAAGIAAFLALPSALSFAVDYGMQGLLGTAFAFIDAGFGLICFAFGFRFGAMALLRRLGGVRRLLALAYAAAAGLFVLACWGLWMRLGYMADLGRAGTLRYPLLAVAALGVSVGAYRLLLCVLGESRGAIRRGLAMLLLSCAFLAFTPLVLTGRPLPMAAPSAAAVPQANATRPNVVWIVMDTCRADALSCYGNPRNTTPNLDKLAAEGTLYEKAISAAPWTLPSHASMFTGLLPSAHGTTAEHQWLPDEATTIAEVLLDNGYRTYACSANPYTGYLHNVGQGFEYSTDLWVSGIASRRTLVGRIKKRLGLLDSGAAEINRIVMHWVREARREGRPFFLFINYMEPHDPYGDAPGSRRWLADEESFARAVQVEQVPRAYVTYRANGTAEDFRLLRALYEGDVTYLDGRIGELIAGLRSAGGLDDTLLIVTSDHGEKLGEHGLIAHGYNLHGVLLHVPLIVRYPREFAAGARARHVVQTTDLFPTILDVAGIPYAARAALDGISLLSSHAAPRYAFAERSMPVTFVKDLIEVPPLRTRVPLLFRAKSVYDGRYRLVWRSGGKCSLYEPAADPSEDMDLIEKEPLRVQQLKAVLEQRFGALRDGWPEAPRSP